MKSVDWLLIFAASLLISCGSTPSPAPVSAAAPAAAASPAPASAPQEAAIGAVRVTASTLNVRREASQSAEVLAQVGSGTRLALLSAGEEWDRVRLSDGRIGYVSARHVSRDGERATRRPTTGCPADRNYSFIKAPTPAFSEGGPHGVVTVEANVDKNGVVQSTRIVSNTTGEQSLATMAEREIKTARFSAPVRNCVARAFVFTYTRTF